MSRIHVHINVDDLAVSKRFYTALFQSSPTIEKPDYAKWALDEPRVNLAISQRHDNEPGIDHLGIQAESDQALDELYSNLASASYAMREERGAKCCYAESDKHWAIDPNGVIWEMFHSVRSTLTYGNDRGPSVEPPPAPANSGSDAACCAGDCGASQPGDAANG